MMSIPFDQAIELKAFRQQHALPDSFGVALFEPKDYTDLGSIQSVQAGAALHTLRQNLLAQKTRSIDALTAFFAAELERINPAIGLREEEIGFAAAGFGDVLRAVFYARVRPSPPPFAEIYRAWLLGTISVASTTHPYPHQGQSWGVQVVSHAYGRVGLLVHLPTHTAYVMDASLACPADGFMFALLGEVCDGVLTL